MTNESEQDKLDVERDAKEKAQFKALNQGWEKLSQYTDAELGHYIRITIEEGLHNSFDGWDPEIEVPIIGEFVLDLAKCVEMEREYEEQANIAIYPPTYTFGDGISWFGLTKSQIDIVEEALKAYYDNRQDDLREIPTSDPIGVSRADYIKEIEGVARRFNFQSFKI